MKRTILVICLTLAVGAVAQRVSTKYIRSTYVSDGEVLVTCKNGADPTGRKIGDSSLLIGCGRLQEPLK